MLKMMLREGLNEIIFPNKDLEQNEGLGLKSSCTI